MSLFGNKHDMVAKTGAIWRPFARIGRNNRSEGVLQAQTKTGRVGASTHTTHTRTICDRVVGEVDLAIVVVIDTSVESVRLGTLRQIISTSNRPLISARVVEVALVTNLDISKANPEAAQHFFCKNFQAIPSGWKSQSFRLR